MDVSFFLIILLFLIAMAVGFFLLKYLEKKLGLIRDRLGEEEAQSNIIRPPFFIRISDIEYIADWFVRRDEKVDNPLLLSMDIVDNLAEETETELNMLMAKRAKFNCYLGALIDFLPEVDRAEGVLREYCWKNEGKEIEENYFKNIKSYIIAKIRIMGWLYYNVYKKFYNQRDSEYLDFTKYIIEENPDEQEKE
ncbi:MAG: hypothetical protein D5R97_02600 [Candidatus Syntrophonatronum acetioxidans]|uniref:Uncharacterized protein n=1 Tax=Candidatus Syntrophonatronum acetioxidans TaxID=1795816 RepID=A0A424YGZ0_9FIRM|nr:MAG: hypothetical protein D5R97_02600 [Candidatus Syntrophonatronum acetioxidans]